jgi:hypothetical protein
MSKLVTVTTIRSPHQFYLSKASSNPTMSYDKPTNSLTVTRLRSECCTGVPTMRMLSFDILLPTVLSMHGIDDVLFLLSLAVRCQACLGQTIPERRVVLYQTTSCPAIKYTITTTNTSYSNPIATHPYPLQNRTSSSSLRVLATA